jgi:prepilin-type N-terminal cleavage/methylation domain-containing protein
MWQLIRKSSKGVTLLELLLVMVIVGAMMAMGIGYIQQQTESLRIDKTAAQMQQILNAGLAYYVNNGAWPGSLGCLQANGTNCTTQYLPLLTSPIPGASSYTIGSDSTGSLFYVQLTLTSGPRAVATAQILSGKLPLSNSTANGGLTVISYVNIPGQDINNSSAVNFAGLYHHGGCVPVPVCPVTLAGVAMTPEVMIVPVSVSGLSDVGTNVYPISSFTGYATGGLGSGSTPTACTGSTSPSPASTCSEGVSTATVKDYWRACLQVITEKGEVAGTGSGTTSWGQYVTLMAITRCIIPNEVSGSDFTTVYSN